jgi:hypothetical protein
MVRRRGAAVNPKQKAGIAPGLWFFVIARSEATKQSIFPLGGIWIASLRSQ